MTSTKGWRSRATGFFAATALAGMTLSGVAYADDISNNLDTSIDAAAETMALNVDGQNGTTQLYVAPANGDGKNGCNLTGSTTLTLAVSSSNTAVATVSPSSVTFTSCSDLKTLTVAPVATGSAAITVSQTSNTTGGSFNLAPASFTVNVTQPAPANTAPIVTVAGVTGGAEYSKDAVPAATCQVTDAEDGNSSFAATLSSVTGPYASDGIGSQTASCSYTDGGGLTASASETYSIVDLSAPVISYTLPALDGDNGWYRGDVTLDWTVSEPQSPGSLQTTDCEDLTISSDQGDTTYTCSATSAGGTASESVTFKRDGTAPTVTASEPTGTLGANGWYTSDVTVDFTATDAPSGPSTVTQAVTSTGEGSAVEVASPAFSDLAGNTTPAGAVTRTYKVDKTAPTNIAFVGGPAAGASYFFEDAPAAPTCTADDSVSQLASCLVAGYSTGVGSHTLTATATDNAGNVATATRTYTVAAWTLKGFYAPVDMSSVTNTVKAGSTVPLKFEAFKGATEITDVSAVKSFTVATYTPTSTGPEDAIETYSTGGTSLRYDATGGQFIQNWQTPKAMAGSMYKVTLTLQDGSTTSAIFKLR